MSIKLSIVLLIKNGENYLNYLDTYFSIIQSTYKDRYVFEYFIFENNSSDNTVDILKKFYKNKKGKFWSEDLSFNKNMNGISNNRCMYMSKLRNMLKSKHGILDSYYTLLIDCDVVFSNKIIENLIESLENSKSCVAISPFDICYVIEHKYNSIHYYDTLAFLPSDVDYNTYKHKSVDTLCNYIHCKKCSKNGKKYINLYDKYKVNSVFGGCLLLYTEVYNKVRWLPKNDDVCEHHSFCNDIRNYGDIYIDTRYFVCTNDPLIVKDINYNTLYTKLDNKYKFSSEINKTIYMTYKKDIPKFVISNWKQKNTLYNIEFSLDNDCIDFLETKFNKYISTLFKNIKRGAHKSDLWRLCKLYLYGGVYADVDLVPHINLDELDKTISLYSCLSMDNKGIFQAFMVVNSPRNILIFSFLLSFLVNIPVLQINGPTHDMYNCLLFNVDDQQLKSEKKYTLNTVDIKIPFGKSETSEKTIDLHYFPDDIEYTVSVYRLRNNDMFRFEIKDHKLHIERIDLKKGWNINFTALISIKCNESFYLFPEVCGPNNNWVESYVTYKGNKILDSRYIEYYKNGGW